MAKKKKNPKLTAEESATVVTLTAGDKTAETTAGELIEANGVGDLAEPVAAVISEAIKLERPPEPTDEELLGQIVDAEKRVQQAEREMNARHEDYKDAKKDFELAVSKLRQVIRQSQEPDGPHLFSKPKGEPVDGETYPTDPRLDNLWREFPLERYTEFGLSSSLIRCLTDNVPPILTVGDLADFTAPKANGYTQPLTDVKGIGKAKVEAIENAGVEFWKRWPNGLQAEFAREKGIVNEPVTGTDGGGAGPIDPGEALADDWAEPGAGDRAEA